MKPNMLFDRWRRRYVRLLKRLDRVRRQCRRTGDVEAVHELRVIVRRLRLFVRLASPFVGRDVAEAYAAWSRELSQTTSAVRDHDVVMEWLASQGDAASLVQSLAARRRLLWRAARTGLTPLPGRLRRSLVHFRTSAKTRRRFSRRYAKRFDRLLVRIRPQLGRFFRMTMEDRHAFRRRLRQLRYLRELVETPGRGAASTLLDRLATPQAHMGELQNLQLVAELLGPALDQPNLRRVRECLRKQELRCGREIRAGLQVLAAAEGVRGPSR